MRYILMFFLLTGVAFAANTEDYRITDGDGHVLDINPVDGSLYVSTTIEVPTIEYGAPDIRVSDDSGDVLDVNSDGSVTATVE